ncbi:preprotein translocase subunit SecA, partial [Campylobacter sp. BCW_8712]
AEYSTNVMNDYMLDESGSNVNFENLKAKILYECSTQISEKDFENLSVIEMQDKLSQILENSYNEKMSRLEIKELRNIERILYLQVLDNAWREHLYQMDILKTGIG